VSACVGIQAWARTCAKPALVGRLALAVAVYMLGSNDAVLRVLDTLFLLLRRELKTAPLMEVEEAWGSGGETGMINTSPSAV
jgi:hypothetical protein